MTMGEAGSASWCPLPQLAVEACGPQTTFNQLMVAQLGIASVLSERWLSALRPFPYLLPFYYSSGVLIHLPTSQHGLTSLSLSLKGRKRFDTMAVHGALNLKLPKREGKIYREEGPSCTFLEGKWL